jgi:hypothetical protein
MLHVETLERPWNTLIYQEMQSLTLNLKTMLINLLTAMVRIKNLKKKEKFVKQNVVKFVALNQIKNLHTWT